MRANLDQAVRRRILAELGVDVWRLRTGVPVRAAGTESQTPDPDSRGAERLALPGEGARSGDGARRDGGVRSGDRRFAEPATGSVSPARPGAAGIEAFSVRSLSAAGVTLLLERSPSGRESRLVRDLLAAASGRWDVEPAQRQFDWPPAVEIPGADGVGAADRALKAFVEKELADHGCTLVLLGEALAQRLGRLKHAGEQLVIPDLAVLGRESADKRRLWTALGRYRLASRIPAARRSAHASPAPDHDAPIGRPGDLPAGRS